MSSEESLNSSSSVVSNGSNISASSRGIDDSGMCTEKSEVNTTGMMDKAQALTIDVALPKHHATQAELTSDLTPPADDLLLTTTAYRTPTYCYNTLSDSYYQSNIPTTVGIYTYNMASPYRCSNVNNSQDLRNFSTWRSPASSYVDMSYQYGYQAEQPQPLNLSMNGPSAYINNEAVYHPAYPWGGVSASSYQEWISTMQQQYHAMGKDTVKWSNILPAPAPGTSAPRLKQKSQKRKPAPAAPYSKPEKINRTSKTEQYKSIHQNIMSIINQYKTKESEQTEIPKNTTVTSPVISQPSDACNPSVLEHIKIQPLPTNTSQHGMFPNPCNSGLAPVEPVTKIQSQASEGPDSSQLVCPTTATPECLERPPTSTAVSEPPVSLYGQPVPVSTMQPPTAAGSCHFMPVQPMSTDMQPQSQPQMLVAPAPMMFMPDSSHAPVPIISQTQHVVNPRRESQPRASKKICFSVGQVEQLTALFNETNYPTTEQKMEMAGKIGITFKQVNIWLNNHRTKLKRIKKQSNDMKETCNPGSAFYPEIFETPPPCLSVTQSDAAIVTAPAACVFGAQPPTITYTS